MTPWSVLGFCLGAPQRGRPEIRNFYLALVTDQHVGRREIVVNEVKWLSVFPRKIMQIGNACEHLEMRKGTKFSKSCGGIGVSR